MRRAFNKILAVILCSLFALTLLPASAAAAGRLAAAPVAKAGISVDTPSIAQIRDFVSKHPMFYGTKRTVAFKTPPNITAPYAAGRVADEDMQDGLNAANIVRYISGLPGNLTLDEEYINKIQHGAVFMAVKDSMQHYPTQDSKPADMSQEFFDEAFAGTSLSNIASGYSFLSNSIIDGYMNDGDPWNISRVGHRRWILNPPLGKTGFGLAYIADIFKTAYSGMFVQDYTNGTDAKYNTIAYPAQNMPVEYTGNYIPYSFIVSDDFGPLDRNKISVAMTRLSDGKVWNFSAAENASNFWVSADNLPGNCIIWKPADITGYKAGDRYSIVIKGVTKNGKPYPVSYNVNYFSLDPSITPPDAPAPEPPPDTPPDTAPAAPEIPASFGASASSVDSIRVNWSASAGATGYELYVSGAKSGKYTLLKKTSALSFTQKKLTTGKAYYYKIRAYLISDGTEYDSPFSKVVSAKPAPLAPTGVKLKKASAGSIKISWKKVAGASKYQVLRAASASGKFSAVTTTSRLSYVNKRLKNRTYYYKIRAYKLIKGKKIYGAYSKTVKLKL